MINSFEAFLIPIDLSNTFSNIYQKYGKQIKLKEIKTLLFNTKFEY